MADGDKKALELIAQAEKKAKNSGGLFSSIFGGFIFSLIFIILYISISCYDVFNLYYNIQILYE